MRKLLLTIIMTLDTIICFGQGMSEQEIKVAMNRIKLDDSFVYGEATMPSLEESKEKARIYLLDSIRENDPDITVSLENISMLSHMRLNMFRTLAYIKKDALNGSSPKMSWTEGEKESLHEALSRSSTVDELAGLNGDGFDMEELSLNTDDAVLKESFVLVVRGRKIAAAYTPVDSEGMRTEIRSGAMSRRMDYSQKDKVFYISVKR